MEWVRVCVKCVHIMRGTYDDVVDAVVHDATERWHIVTEAGTDDSNAVEIALARFSSSC